MLGDHPILCDPTMVISALGLLVFFERRLIAVIRAVAATIRAGRVLLTELMIKKKVKGAYAPRALCFSAYFGFQGVASV
jgi:hypothetical protein